MTKIYKIKAKSEGRNGPRLEFAVFADTLKLAEAAARVKLAEEGYKYARIETITEVPK